MKEHLKIAIDGPAASGKGTVAKKVAAYYGLNCLDTGKLYRLVACNFLKEEPNFNGIIDDFIIHKATSIAKNINHTQLTLPELEDEEVGKAASIISSIKGVRDSLFAFQVNFAKNGAVLDGRDIGTVILPQADFKFFITADVQIRAMRRFNQIKSLQNNNKLFTYEQILNDLKLRDRQDISRTLAPLNIAKGAHVIDTTNLSPDEVVAKIVGIINLS
jgi:cytidylate kinase